MHDEKETLHRYLRSTRAAVRWKLEGLSEHDLRRPMTPTGTNLLGLLRHLATVEAEYLGLVFGRPIAEPMPWSGDGSAPNDDMWVRADESTQDVFDFADRSAAHADATVAALDLDDEGHVPWWAAPPNPVTLHLILVHLVAEWNRHAGHADIVRETIDRAVGLRPGVPNLPDEGEGWWSDYVDRVQAAADTRSGGTGSVG